MPNWSLLLVFVLAQALLPRAAALARGWPATAELRAEVLDLLVRQRSAAEEEEEDRADDSAVSPGAVATTGLLHTLADFIRAREEIRREIDVLTAEGRVSAFVLGGLPVFLLFAIQVLSPGYMDPMFRGWGWIWLGGAAAITAASIGIILRMVNSVEV